MNELKIFTNKEYGDIRTVMIDNEPWFAVSDVCKALEIGNPSQAIARLDDDEKMTTLISNEGAASGKSQMAFVNEPGLYSLVLGSRKPEAKAFKRWITHDVIPQIRRTGGYHLPQTYPEALRALADQAEEMERLALENKEMQPKAEYFDALVERNLLTNFRDTAKELGIKPKKFIAFLIEHKFIYRDYYGNIKPYSQKNDGLFELKEFNSGSSDYSGVQTLITPRGRETFRLLISN